MKIKTILLSGLLIFTGACSTVGGRLSTAEGDAMMKTGKWTKVDSETAAAEIMAQMTSHPVFADYAGKLGHKPKLFIRDVENKTADPYFRVDELNNALLNRISRSGRFVLIDRAAAQKINQEIVYQMSGTVKRDDIRKIAETGAEMLIFGEITMEPVIQDGLTVNEYTVNMRLTDISSKEEIARMDYTTTKYVKRGAFSW